MNHSTTDNYGRQIVLSNINEQHQRSQITQQPRDILEEDEYTSTLSHIVTRDYFPSLPSLRRDEAILDARSRGDISGAVSIRRIARKEEMQHEREWQEEMEEEKQATNNTTETAIQPSSYNNNMQNNSVQIRKRPRPLKHETITGFHSRVTTEDNAEFESIQECERNDREEKMGIIYSAKANKSGRLMIENAYNDKEKEEKINPYNKAARALCDTPIGLSSDLYDAPPSAGLRITDGGNSGEKNNGIGRNGLFFQPLHRSLDNNKTTKTNSDKLLLTSSGSGTFLALENGEDASKEKQQQDGTNLLMLPPPPRKPSSSSNVMVSHQQPTDDQKSIDDRCQLVEYLPKPALPDIYPPATRFPYQSESRMLAKKINSLGPVYNRQGSKDSYTSTSETTDLDASPRSLERERAAYQKAKKRENETFVAMTPLIRPGAGGNVSRNEPNDEPIMTWGDVQSTPLVLGSGSAVDGRAGASSSADWEPSRPEEASFSSGNDGGSESSSLPAFDVVDDSRRERMARKAERGLLERAKTYRTAGCSKTKSRKDDHDDQSVGSSRSAMSSRSAKSAGTVTTLDRKASLTPAARALLEAGSKKTKTNSRSSIFQASSKSSNIRSRDSFGSALRISYTPNRESASKRTGTSSSSVSSSLRRAAGGATPRCQTLR